MVLIKKTGITPAPHRQGVNQKMKSPQAAVTVKKEGGQTAKKMPMAAKKTISKPKESKPPVSKPTKQEHPKEEEATVPKARRRARNGQKTTRERARLCKELRVETARQWFSTKARAAIAELDEEGFFSVKGVAAPIYISAKALYLTQQIAEAIHIQRVGAASYISLRTSEMGRQTVRGFDMDTEERIRKGTFHLEYLTKRHL